MTEKRAQRRLAAILAADVVSYSGFMGHDEAGTMAALKARRNDVNLGVMDLRGQGVAQDYAEALKWYRKAADQGHASAQANLGVFYNKGHGVSQDYAEAAKWYRLAAEQGDAPSQCNLGALYAKGQGVPQDFVQAHVWLNLGTAEGKAREDGIKARDMLLAVLTPEQIAASQRLAREWTAAHPKK